VPSAYSSRGATIPEQPSGQKRTIYELRALLGRFKADAEFLYRYQNLAYVHKVIEPLGTTDRVRLLALALAEQDEDVRAVARHVCSQLALPDRLEDLLARLSPEERQEVEQVSSTREPGAPTDMPAELEERVRKELRGLREELSELDVEEAYWVLLTDKEHEAGAWIPAWGSSRDQDEILLPTKVLYRPQKDEHYELLQRIRHSVLALHVHNHPPHPGINFLDASDDDRNTAASWKTTWPDLAHKLRFFVIAGPYVFEYSLPGRGTRQWDV
jgi:hypothetical protein